MTNTTEQETYTVKICRDCGAEYSTSGMTSRHRDTMGHTGGFKTVKRTRDRRPSVISYQPNYAHLAGK